MKFFVTSDIHSYFTPFKDALNKAGFDPNNEDHWLVVCGDMFDRGPESVELLHFIMSLKRKILVRGNHDLLLEECCNRGFPYSYDKSNGTVRTIQDIGGSKDSRYFDGCCQMTWNKTARYRELLVNYFETQNYIFVHSFIPVNSEGKYNPIYTYREDWRNANDVEFELAMWGNPFKMADQGLNKTGKIIVFGHWHCSAGHKMLGRCKTEFGEDAIWEPCCAQGIIGIDRCTAHTGEVNVVVLEDTLLDG